MFLLHKHKIINIKIISITTAQQLKFCWTVSVVCGKTAGAADSKISNQPVTFESNQYYPIRFRSFAGPYFSFTPFLSLRRTWCNGAEEKYEEAEWKENQLTRFHLERWPLKCYVCVWMCMAEDNIMHTWSYFCTTRPAPELWWLSGG